MAAALNGHQITDENGEATQEEQETSSEESAATETQTTEQQTAMAEKPVETEAEAIPAEAEESESELAEDATGKRYVPEKRFKEVYGKAKAEERARLEEQKKREALEVALLQIQTGQVNPTMPVQPNVASQVDRTTSLEVELLKGKLPQFDPESPNYSEALDKLGAKIFAANPGITRLDAAKEAMKMANELTSQVANVKAEARLIKSIQSDQGITNRATRVTSTTPDIDKMDDKQLESYLKANGMW